MSFEDGVLGDGDMIRYVQKNLMHLKRGELLRVYELVKKKVE